MNETEIAMKAWRDHQAENPLRRTTVLESAPIEIKNNIDTVALGEQVRIFREELKNLPRPEVIIELSQLTRVVRDMMQANREIVSSLKKFSEVTPAPVIVNTDALAKIQAEANQRQETILARIEEQLTAIVSLLTRPAPPRTVKITSPLAEYTGEIK